MAIWGEWKRFFRAEACSPGQPMAGGSVPWQQTSINWWSWWHRNPNLTGYWWISMPLPANTAIWMFASSSTRLTV
jgi:hypothetical protein